MIDKSKKAYYTAVRKLLTLMTASGKNVLEVSLYEDVHQQTLDEFRNEIGVDYEYNLVHKGQVRIRKKA